MVKSINLTHNWSDTEKALLRDAKQIPFATAVALTRSARLAQGEIKAEMVRVFDRPTKFALNALFVRPASKTNLEAQLAFRIAGGGSLMRSDQYLGPQIEGGGRVHKRSERALQAWMAAAGVSGGYWVPGQAARLDQYGNVSRGQITQVLSALKAGSDPTQFATGAGRGQRKQRKAGTRYFVPGSNSTLHPGVWQVQAGGVKPILMFVRQPRYTPRLDFYGIGQRVAEERFEQEFIEAYAKAIATAR